MTAILSPPLHGCTISASLPVTARQIPTDLARWDHVAYACSRAPVILRQVGFPEDKIPRVLAAIRQHLPGDEPGTIEATILRDADILEQLGAIGILRTVSKVGRDTRFPRFTDAVAVLRRNLDELPGQLRLESARRLAAPRIANPAAIPSGRP